MMMYRTFMKKFVVLTLVIVTQPSCSNSDNLALLAGTLRTMQRAACDEETVSLSCSRGTSISIQRAKYAETVPVEHICQSERLYPVTVEIVGKQNNCLWPNDMQYSLLQTAVEACQKKPQCEFSTTPKSKKDPCPATRKFVEISYKCRPYEFRSRTGCEGDIIKLSCNPYSRVAIFDAIYGRTAYESIQCPQAQGVKDEKWPEPPVTVSTVVHVKQDRWQAYCCTDRIRPCNTSFAVEAVMQLCHGKRRCQVVANSRTFGTPCRPLTRTYLKIIYTCVPLGVLSEKYESPAERDEVPDVILPRADNGLFDESDGPIEKWVELSSVAPAPAVVANPDIPPMPDLVTPSSKKTITTSIATNKSTESESKGKLFTYLGVGVAVFLILIILLIGVRYYITRRDARKTKSPDMFSTEVPNVFNDAISDIDNDIDVSHISGTFYDPVHPDMILYREHPGTKGSLRAMRPLSTIYPCAGASMYGNVDYIPRSQSKDETTRTSKIDEEFETEGVVSPRSLGRYSNSQFYYG